jgi:hypothetical protein
MPTKSKLKLKPVDYAQRALLTTIDKFLAAAQD